MEKGPWPSDTPEQHPVARGASVERFKNLLEVLARKGDLAEGGSFMYITPDASAGVFFSERGIQFAYFYLTDPQTQYRHMYRVHEDGTVSKQIKVEMRGANVATDMEALEALEEKYGDDQEKIDAEFEKYLSAGEEKVKQRKKAEEEARKMGMTVLTEAEMNSVNEQLENLILRASR